MVKSLLIRPAPRPIDCEVTLPGSKSYTNRALLIAALAEGKSTLIGASPSRDSEAMVGALRQMGFAIDESGDRIVLEGCSGCPAPFTGTLDVGPAGTTMRFLVALTALMRGADVVLRGSERMHERPIDGLVEPLRAIGARIEYLGRAGCPPLRVHGSAALSSGKISIDCSKSSQFLSGILMIAPVIPNGLTISVPGEFVSQSYIEMTIDTMRYFGAAVERPDDRTFIVSGTGYRAREYRVECDVSGAGYFWGLAAAAVGAVRVRGVNPHSAQGDIRFPELLADMGCAVTRGEDWIEVRGTTDLRAIQCDMTLLPDSAQTLAVVAARARGNTTIEGLSTLRIKETDRLGALKAELFKTSIDALISNDSITVRGGTPAFARIATYDDHRMAMAFSLLGARDDGICIEEPEVVAKSLPQYWQLLAATGISIHEGG